MSIDISLRVSHYPFSTDLTGNLAPMASACGLYDALWGTPALCRRPLFDATTGKDLICPLEAGLAQAVIARPPQRPPVTQLEYRQLIEDCLDDLAELVDKAVMHRWPVVLDEEEVREFIRHWRDQVGAL